MKWKRRGLVFEPQKYTLPDGCKDFAQSPQAVVLADRVRIYFSSRARDDAGKIVSRVLFCDMDRSLTRVIDVCRREAIPLGERGAFDEHGIFPFHVMRHGERLYAYTCGWSRRVSVPVETSIGLATSDDDGLTFQRHGVGPVLTSSLQEPCLVGDGFVRVHASRWHMWYIFGQRWLPGAERDGQPARVYKIAHAASADGVVWEKEHDGAAIVPDAIGGDECQALPTVCSFQGAHHMVFCFRYATDFRTNPARGYRLGYARSTDLAQWTRADQELGLDVSADGWDSEMMCYPHLFECDGKVYLLYNGNAFGRGGFGLAELEP